MNDIETATQAPNQDALVEKWLCEATPDAASRLDELARSADGKAIRKSARRAIYLLRQRGIVSLIDTGIPQEAPPVAHSEETMRAWASAYDGAGNRLFLLLLAGWDGGDSTMAQILANDELGIRNLTIERHRRREIAPVIERIEARIDDGLAIAEIEPDYARHWIEQFRRLNLKRSTTTPSGFLDIAPRIGPPIGTYEHPVVYDHVDLENGIAEAEPSSDPSDLFKLTWFDPWFLAVEEVRPWLRRWIEADDSSNVTDVEARKLARSALAKEAAVDLIPEALRGRYITRLEESADVLRRRGKSDEARMALLQARALSADVPIGDVPFAVGVVVRTLEAALEMTIESARRVADSATVVGD